jgi:hypothetical protein
MKRFVFCLCTILPFGGCGSEPDGVVRTKDAGQDAVQEQIQKSLADNPVKKDIGTGNAATGGYDPISGQKIGGKPHETGATSGGGTSSAIFD